MQHGPDLSFYPGAWTQSRFGSFRLACALAGLRPLRVAHGLDTGWQAIRLAIMAKRAFLSKAMPEPTTLQHRLTGLQRLRINPTELTKVTVCTRPFRAQGPRLEAERFGDKLLVHNYGHGGSGWSLSWGCAALVVPLALQAGANEVAVIGCGAMGLTSALALQRAGVRVRIYARDLPPATRSARATGTWTPDARVALERSVTPGFAEQWEQIARCSYAAYQELLQLPGTPVELHDRYTLSERPPDQAWAERVRNDAVGFARLEHRIEDLYPATEDFGPRMHPFATAYCRHTRGYRFHIAGYSEHLEREFRARGGTIHQAEFHAASDLLQVPEPVLVHCTGYGARALFGDESLTPIRGQISWLPPQADLPYSLVWEDLNLVPRRDGTVVQWGAQGDATGWQEADEEPSAAEAESALAKARTLCEGWVDRP